MGGYKMFNIRSVAHKLCGSKYQLGDVSSVFDRLDKELDYMEAHGMLHDLEVLYQWSRELEDKNIKYYCSGATATSFALYILGISRTNPLPPHRYCEQCGRIEFTFEINNEGFDLHDEDCSCGGQLIGDGHFLDHRLLFRMNNMPDHFSICVDSSGFDATMRIMQTLYKNTRIIIPCRDTICFGHIDFSEDLQLNDCPVQSFNREFSYSGRMMYIIELMMEVQKGQNILDPENKVSFDRIKTVNDYIRFVGLIHDKWKEPLPLSSSNNWPYKVSIGGLPVVFSDELWIPTENTENEAGITESYQLYDSARVGMLEYQRTSRKGKDHFYLDWFQNIRYLYPRAHILEMFNFCFLMQKDSSRKEKVTK